MKNLFLALSLFSGIIWISCGGPEIITPIDPSIQAAEDSATIVNYLDDLNLLGMDSMLATGVHYVVLDSGDSNAIDESDIVSFNYTGMLLSDSIFDTTIEEIADSIRIAVEAGITPGDTSITEFTYLLSFSEERTFSPIEYTYSGSGWTLGSVGFIPGFTSGVSASFNGLKSGGSTLILIPSAQAYGTRGSGVLIGPNTVIAFKLEVIDVIKQGE